MTDTNLITQIIALSWAAAVSPTVLSFFLITVSMSDNPRLSGLSFYAGAVSVLLITVVIGIFLGGALTSTGHGDPATTGAIDIFLGSILFLLGLKSLFSKNGINSSLTNFLHISSDSSTFAKFRRYFTIGLLTFLTNLSTAIFVLAAGREIGLSKTGIWIELGSIALLTIITLILIEVPLLFFLLVPKKAEKVTKPMNNWISKHSNWIMAGFLIIIGLLVIYNGLGRLKVV
ncbi:MAG: GAP family protein [Methanobacteriaceae archaeon]|nr:GAP family protein [Methanobacteriaceae archaeon]